MTLRAVTASCGVTTGYWFSPQGNPASSDLVLPAIVQGTQFPNADGSPSTLSVSLDDAYLWNVDLRSEGFPPVLFEGFVPSAGDLFAELAAQGWTSL